MSKAKLGLLIVLLAVGGVGVYIASLPNPAELKATTPKESAFMQLRKEEAQAEGKTLRLRHTYVALRAVTPLLREAVMLSEDASFYDHDGFDFDELEAAMKQAMEKGRMVRGASTISQQLVKNLYLSPSRNPLRKVAEAWLTQRMEDAVSKDRILELYLNFAEWGEGVFGIEAASRKHFSTSAGALTPAQSVLLAAMLPMPLKVDPAHPTKWLTKRARRLLKLLHARGRITDAELLDAQNGL